MTETPDEPERLPASLRLLKWLVMGLTVTMIGGVITVVWLLVTRMPLPHLAPPMPKTLELPAGVTATAVTMGGDWIAVVGSDEHIFIFSRSGKLRQEIAITHDK